jgi:hypothetical protein
VAWCGFVWDDDLRVTENATLRSLDGLRRIWLEVGANKQYYPLVFSSFWVEYQLWGANPVGYHLVNLALHAAASVLFWRVLLALGVPGAWLAAAMFALHPVHVESVAWISERKNLLSGVLYLASALAWLRHAEADERGEPRASRLYAASLALFLCALLAKTVACTLPAALLLTLWWKRGRVAGRDALTLLPFFALGIGLGLVTVWLERSEVGASGAAWDLSFPERFLIAGRAVWFYLGKLVWPAPLISTIRAGASTPGRPGSTCTHWRRSPSWLRSGCCAAGSARGPLAAWLFFGGTLLPALGFFEVYPMRHPGLREPLREQRQIGGGRGSRLPLITHD